MISDYAGAGSIRQDVQEAIEKELNYRLGDGEAPGALIRWQKELVLLAINTVKPNACLSQLHARAAIRAGATLEQVLQVTLYQLLTGMVKWRMVGMEAFTAAEADVAESERIISGGEAWAGKEQRIREIEQYVRQVLPHNKELSDMLKKLLDIAPGILDGYMRMRESFIKPDPLGALPKKIMELAMISADIVQAHTSGAKLHAMQAVKDGATVPEVVEAVALVMIEVGVPSYNDGGREAIEVAEKTIV